MPHDTMSSYIYVVAFVSIFAGSFVAGLAGFAFSAVAGAILLHFAPATAAVPLLLACSITTQLISVMKLWKTMLWRQCMPYLAGGLAGLPLGTAVLRGVDPRVFAIGFGSFLVCYSAYTLYKPGIRITIKSRFADILVGGLGGLTGGSVAFPGAVPAIWCGLRGLDKNEQRGILQPYILIMQFATMIYFAKLGMLSSSTAIIYAWCVPAVLAGTFVGLKCFDKVDGKMFQKLVLFFLLISGTSLVL